MTTITTLTLVLGGWVTSAARTQNHNGFVKRTVTVFGQIFNYQVFVPDGWTADQKWPVILYLHGAGERGQDGIRQTKVGLGPAIQKDSSRFPAVVVMPQCRRRVWWNDPVMEALLLKSLDQSIQEFNGDEDRTYLTGLSMGGYATFYLGAKYPGKCAALVPVCGGIVPPQTRRGSTVSWGQSSDPYADVASKIKGTPVWAFHGSADRSVPVTESQKIVEALRKLGGDVKYTEYEGVGHNSWDKAYAEPELMKWMLSQHRQ